MTELPHIVIFGTGEFAGRILHDIAATARKPVKVTVAGIDTERAAWLKLAANSRAAIFGTPVKVDSLIVDLMNRDATEAAVTKLRPNVAIQAASLQTTAVIGHRSDGWSQLVAEGGLSVTAVFQSLLSIRVGEALKKIAPNCLHVNCCFPDVVNTLIAAAGLPIACGVGNIAILSSTFTAVRPDLAAKGMRVLAHYQALGPFRRPPEERKGPLPRVWIGNDELPDVYATFREVRLTTRPAVDVSGACSVPLLLAMAAGEEHRTHAPAPNGLPGGYPIRLRGGRIELDLPSGISEAEAIAWNTAFEARNGLTVTPAGHVTYNGQLAERLRSYSPDIAAGFHISELEMVHATMEQFRAKLQAQPPR